MESTGKSQRLVFPLPRVRKVKKVGGCALHAPDGAVPRLFVFAVGGAQDDGGGTEGEERSVFDDGEHFDDRDTGQQFLAHETHTSLWMRARESQAEATALESMST